MKFVACGAQSGGKSSVIRTVSGIPLPEDSNCCTRIAILIQLRRDEKTSITVSLTGLDGAAIKTTPVSDTSDVRNIVIEYQKEALGDNDFVEDKSIVIKYLSPNNVNLSLIDLPGFTNDSDDKEKIVQDVVQKYIKMDGTLCLHVCKGDQDYGSILGNDFMRKKANNVPRVTVLTHCDRIEQNQYDQIKNTVLKASEHGTLVCAIDGRSDSDSDSDDVLKSIASLVPNLSYGVKTLHQHLETRIDHHISDQYPKAIEKLEEYLQSTDKDIDDNKEKTPHEIIMELAIDLGKSFDDTTLHLLNEIRTCLETMQFNIRTFKLTSKSPSSCYPMFDQFDDLEVNEQLIVDIDKNQQDVECTFVSRNCSNSKIKVKKTKTDQIFEFEQSAVFTYNHRSDCCVEDIKIMAKDRGMKNLLHIDRQPIISEYAKQFADYYKKHMLDAIDAIALIMNSFFDDLQNSVKDDIAKILAKLHGNEMITLVEQCKQSAKNAANAAYMHNAESLLVFDSNDHYLSDLVSKMVGEDTGMATDDGAARHIYHNVRPYIKSQRKHISELATKEIMRTMFIECKVGFWSSLKSLMKYYNEVIEPIHVTTRRKQQLRQRHDLLSDAINELRAAQS